MPAILENLPIPTAEIVTGFSINNNPVNFKPLQIPVWLCISRHQDAPVCPRTNPFPAILDTGNSHFLSLGEHHALQWTECHPNTLTIDRRVHVRVSGGILQVPLVRCRIWLYPNIPGQIELDRRREPIRIDSDGIVLYPKDTSPDFPRIPIVGMQSLILNRMTLTIEGDRARVDCAIPET